MKEIKIDSRYKYVFDDSLNKWNLFYRNKIHPDLPDRIFKYFKCNIQNIASLHDGYFWLANPASFNDPFDCNLNLVEYENDTIDQLPYKFRRNDIKNIGVSCFSRRIDDPLMWAHYTDNYYGFAVKYKKITVKINPDIKQKMDFQPVIYTDNFRIIKNTAPIAQSYVLTVKSKRWSHEKEWRILRAINDDKDRQLYYEKNIIEKVYIGHKIPDTDNAAYWLLSNIVEEKYPNAKIYVVYPHPNKLKLNFEQVYPYK